MASKPAAKKVKMTMEKEEMKEEKKGKSLVDVVKGTPELSTLLELIKTVDKDGSIVKMLSKPEQTFTIFAPTNKAFEELMKKIGKLPDNETLKNIILYHVIPMTQRSADLMEELKMGKMMDDVYYKTFKTAWNSNPVVLKFNQKTKKIKVCGATVKKADLESMAGVVHIIDQVLLPQQCVQESFK